MPNPTPSQPDDAIGLPSPGTCIDGKYVVESVLGMGGMGAVLLAVDSMLGQRVAVKLLLPKVAADSVMVSRFLREAQAAAAIQNDHVVRIFGVGKTDTGLPYIVMEHLVGAGLDEVLARNGPLPIPYVIDVLLEACHALAHAHTIGIVHRDLKPSNLFVCRLPDGSERIKILDFGISKAEGLPGVEALTATMQVMGTPAYMSPEQARSTKNIDSRADIWSLGVVGYELLCGTTPFAADSLSAVIAKIVADPPPRPTLSRPDLPEPLERALLWCLEKDPARRPQSVSVLVPHLRPFASPRGQAVAQSVLRIQDSDSVLTGLRIDARGVVAPAKPRAHRWLPAAITASVAAAAVAVTAWLLSRHAVESPGSSPAACASPSVPQPVSSPVSAASADVASSVPPRDSASPPVPAPTSSSRATPQRIPPAPARTPDPFDRF